VLRSLLSDCGWLATAMASFGLLCMLRKPTRETWVFLCFPAVYALELLTLSKSFARYLLPQAAFIAVAAGYGVDQFLGLLTPRWEARAVRRLGVGLCLLMLVQPLLLSASWAELQANRVDTRTMALAWVERELVPQSSVSLQGLYDRTFDNVPIVTDKVLSRLDRILPNTGRFATVRESILDTWRARPVFRDVGFSDSLPELQAASPRYVLLTDAYGAHPAALLGWLGSQGQLLHRVAPELPWSFGLVHQDIAEFLPVIPPTLSIYELSRPLEKGPQVTAP
jgi:hypothetical protein